MNPTRKQQEFLALYEPVHNKFAAFCQAKCYGRMETKDLVNETLLIAFEKIATLRSEKAFLSFLIGISIRILANSKKKRREELPGKLGTTNLTTSIDATAVKTDINILYEMMAQLPEKESECILLFELSGFSIKEIMKIQGASESAVKQRLKRARMKLKELLEFELKTK